jgi:predicted nucleotidyltransferase
LAELDIRGILAELTQEGVDFLIIGGIAVGYHGHVRATKDVDVVPKPEEQNYKRLAAALERLEAQVEGADEFDPAELPDPFDPSALAERGNWVLYTRLGRLDIMQWQGDEPLWEKLAKAAITDHISDLPVRMVDYEDLLSLKEDAARPEDLIDVERLREVREDS